MTAIRLCSFSCSRCCCSCSCSCCCFCSCSCCCLCSCSCCCFCSCSCCCFCSCSCCCFCSCSCCCFCSYSCCCFCSCSCCCFVLVLVVVFVLVLVLVVVVVDVVVVVVVAAAVVVVVVATAICYTNLPVTRAFRSCAEGSGHEKLGFTLVFAKELSSKAPANWWWTSDLAEPQLFSSHQSPTCAEREDKGGGSPNPLPGDGSWMNIHTVLKTRDNFTWHHYIATCSFLSFPAHGIRIHFKLWQSWTQSCSEPVTHNPRPRPDTLQTMHAHESKSLWWDTFRGVEPTSQTAQQAMTKQSRIRQAQG